MKIVYAIPVEAADIWGGVLERERINFWLVSYFYTKKCPENELERYAYAKLKDVSKRKRKLR